MSTSLEWRPPLEASCRRPCPYIRVHPHGSPARRHPPYFTWPGVSGSPGRSPSPGRFCHHLMAIFKRNLRTTRPTAPRWKARIGICQKARQQRVSVVQGEGQEVQGGCCAYIGRASGRVHACGEGTPRASRPFRTTGRDEMVMAARVVVRVAVVRLRAKETGAMVRAATRRGW